MLRYINVSYRADSSIYFESVMAFFSRREIYLCIGTFLLALISVPLLKKIPLDIFPTKWYIKIVITQEVLNEDA